MDKIYLQDLKQYGREIYLDLETRTKELLRQLIVLNFKSYANFSRHIGLKLDSLSRNNDLIHFFEGHKISLILLDKIITPFKKDLSYKQIELNISRLGSRRGTNDIINPKFPFRFNNVHGARIVSSILHDGGLSSVGQPFYVNNVGIMRKQVIESYQKVFGNIKYREYNKKYVVFPKIVGTIIHSMGIPKGKKVISNPEIPNYIINSSQEIKSVFLRQAFDDEGYIGKAGLVLPISLKPVPNKLGPPNILIGLCKLLNDLNIGMNGPNHVLTYSTKNNEIREKWHITINHRRDLEMFNKLIGFSIDYKQKNLEKKLSSYKSDKYTLKKNERYLEAIKTSETLSQKYSSFTITLMAKELGIDYHYAKQLIWRLLKDNRIVQKNNAYPNQYSMS